MKIRATGSISLLICVVTCFSQESGDMGKSTARTPIPIYITPFYDSDGLKIEVGEHSKKLKDADAKSAMKLSTALKKEKDKLRAEAMNVLAIRLYDLGYKDEAVYWFYTAQYKGRQFAVLADQKKLGSIGSPGFELDQAQNAFFELVGPDINGYALGNTVALAAVIARVQKENATVGDVRAIYPGVAFIAKTQWPAKNADLNSGLGKLGASILAQKDATNQQRIQNGTAARFSQLKSTPFPGGY